MFGKRLAIALASALVLTVCFGCGPHEAAHNHVDANNDGVCDDCGKNIGEDLPDVDSDREKETFKLSDYTDLPEVQFTSVRAVQETGSAKFKMTAKWTDRYEVEFSNKAVSLVEIFDKEGKLLKSERSAFDIQLDAGQTIFVRIVPVKKSARITVTAEENESPLPFDLVNVPDASSFKTTSDDPTVSPLEPAELKYVKRENTQYIYSNAPETLVPEVVNKCQTRQDVSNQSVYFTFEHQCREVGPVYYGYRVTNTGKEDMYVTVKNVGFQFDGSGAYLGEREWTDFYNTKFALPDIQSLSDSQQKLYEGFYGFSGQYVVHDFQPTTYRVPAGQYMYVMGGTTQDSFDAINVADTANRIARNAIVENGAVLFDVVGEAEGAFYIYNDISKVMPGGEGCNTHLGGTIQPEASCGNDVGYVVDNSAVWTFNDATAAQTLPVNYTNYYSDIVGTVRVEGPGGVEGMPNQPIEGTGPHRQLNKLEWVTHIDVQQKHRDGRHLLPHGG